MQRLGISWAFAVIGLTVGIVSCSTEPPSKGKADAGSVSEACKDSTASTLDEVFEAHFAERRATGCATTACHGGDSSGGLKFNDAASFYAATVNQTAESGQVLIKPNDPDHSYLFAKLQPGADDRMPKDKTGLDAAALAAVKGWICAGAPEPAGHAAPTIQKFEPKEGAFGTTVTITGANFPLEMSALHLDFHGTEAIVLSSTATEIVTAVPEGATTGLIHVKSGQDEVYTTESFTVMQLNPTPSISSISPTETSMGGGDLELTVKGLAFAPTSIVKIDGTNVATLRESSTVLKATIPAANFKQTGTRNITVSSPPPGGGESFPAILSVVNPVPTITEISPAFVKVNNGQTALTVTGTNFVPTSQIQFNNSLLTTNFVSSTSLTATISGSSLMTIGSYPVRVVTPAPGGGTSNDATFNVVASNPQPLLNSLLPPSFAVGSASSTLTARGGNFVSTSVVSINGQPRQTLFVSATELQATLLTSDLSTLGDFPITVTSPMPGGGTSSPMNISVVPPNATPVLDSISPSTITAGGIAFTLTATGSQFLQGSQIQFNGQTKTTTFGSSTSLSASIAASDILSGGTYAISVRTPAPGGGVSNDVTLTVNNPVPAASMLVPNNVEQNSTAQTITVSGLKFVPASVAYFNGMPRKTTFVNVQHVTVDLLASDFTSTGVYTLNVQNPTPGGGTSASLNFTVNNPKPTILSMVPPGVVAGGADFTLTVTGSSFVPGAKVTFNNMALTTTASPDGSLSATVPATAFATWPSSSMVNVVVTNPAPGGGASVAANFGVASRAVTLTSDVQPIFDAKCVSCHSSPPMSGVPFSLTSTDSYSLLIGPMAAQCTTGTNRKRVVAGDPSTKGSYLIAKLKGTDMCSGVKMPKSGTITTTGTGAANQLQTIIDWIAQGAPQ